MENKIKKITDKEMDKQLCLLSVTTHTDRERKREIERDRDTESIKSVAWAIKNENGQGGLSTFISCS